MEEEKEKAQETVGIKRTITEIFVGPQTEAVPLLKSDDSLSKAAVDKKSSVDESCLSPIHSDLKSQGKNCSSPVARSSPEPSCAICLGPLQNKSFTDSCFHTFCFTCLVEWSKVKAECPLCKQRFKSIVHNVRSFEDYDQYYISSRTVSESSFQNANGRRFRYSSTLTAERLLERRRRIAIEDQYASHRLLYAPHSVSTFHPPTMLNTDYPYSSNFRRRIYEDRMWVKPLNTGRTRCTTPEFYRQNQACTHRLIPWLSRELLALLYNSESQVMFVLDLILALIMRFDIRSQEFFVHIQPYLGDRTSHFIHEFYNFASSPFDMHSYDSRVSYERLETFDNSIVISSPGSDVVALTQNDDSVMFELPSASNTLKSTTSRHKTSKKKSTKRVTKLYLRRDQERDVWQSVWGSSEEVDNSPSPLHSEIHISTDLQQFLDTGIMPGPSVSRNEGEVYTLSASSNTHTVTSSVSEDEDCVIVDVVKPRSQRTPEVIDILSSTDDETVDVVGPDPVESTENPSSHDVSLQTVEIPSLEKVSFDGNADAHIRQNKEHRKQSKSSSGRQSRSSKSQKYKHKSSEKSSKKSKSKHQTSKSHTSHVYAHPLDQEHCDRHTSSSHSQDYKSQSASPNARLSRKVYKYHDSYYDSESTETYVSSSSEDDMYLGDKKSNSPKKSKLRSCCIVAQPADHHYSRSDSSCFSTHSKKHKHKKKKKHEKSKRHRHRTYSEESG